MNIQTHHHHLGVDVGEVRSQGIGNGCGSEEGRPALWHPLLRLGLGGSEGRLLGLGRVGG